MSREQYPFSAIGGAVSELRFTIAFYPFCIEILAPMFLTHNHVILSLEAKTFTETLDKSVTCTITSY